MSSIGPQLPPHLSKRKRSPSDASAPPPSKTTRPSNDDNSDDSDDAYGPSAPKAAGPTMPPSAPTTRPSIGPDMPPNTADEHASSSSDDDTGPAPPPPAIKRTHGPAPPPAPLSERPSTNPAPNPDSDSDSDSDTYGPAPPSSTRRGPMGPSLPPTTAAPARLQRDEWMTLPPTGSDGYQERDPTKIKSRKFASGSTATTRPKDGGGSAGIAAIWTETPLEKAARLRDAVLGRASAGEAEARETNGGGRSGVSGIGSGRARETEAVREERIRAFTASTRGRSLVEVHQAAKKAGAGAKKGGEEGDDEEDDEEDDDPSKRAFDREKDMAISGKMTASQRKQLLNKASDFGGRFSKGNYL